MGWIMSLLLFFTWALFKQDCGYILIASSFFAIAGGFEMIASRIKQHSIISNVKILRELEKEDGA